MAKIVLRKRFFKEEYWMGRILIFHEADHISLDRLNESWKWSALHQNEREMSV